MVLRVAPTGLPVAGSSSGNAIVVVGIIVSYCGGVVDCHGLHTGVVRMDFIEGQNLLKRSPPRLMILRELDERHQTEQDFCQNRKQNICLL